MAAGRAPLLRKILCIPLFLLLAHGDGVLGCYTYIFSFGDSLADTGNLLHDQPGKDLKFARLPYGETYFHRATGRASDGRLVIDFIAQSLGLSLVPPYLGCKNCGRKNFREGVNFAVVGATALDATFFQERGIINPAANYSLGIQLEWFKKLLPSLCDSPLHCHELMRTSLFLVGEIGGNDYDYALFQGRSFKEIEAFVPPVIQKIASAINMLIEHGAVTLMVPGNLPIGCSASYLTSFMSPNKEDYDPTTGCLNWLNKFSEYYNYVLQIELDRIRELYPHANIIYADYYHAAMRFYLSPHQFGFSTGGALTACCGGEGPYNFNKSVTCGNRGANVCDDPSLYVSWDGWHLTEAAYRLIASGLLQGPYTVPHIDTSCPSMAMNA